MDGMAQRRLEPARGVARDELVVGVARHRRHRFPARTESVRARYGRDELAVVAAAAARAGMTPSGYVAAGGVDRGHRLDEGRTSQLPSCGHLRFGAIGAMMAPW